ncbi:hypothetical protein Glove_543g19 [Diversispora epigaea]|uniref:Uncharacterized protein n=1 Tax=Diversispora epigaea TaxID=1348612 RepID=A0A397GEV4_9GLOM|nr:hypothetical protein Glove_543g19 [Diversispora epigaea]
MNTLNAVSNTWTTLNISENLPLPCYEYAANIFPNGVIVYIGGIEQVSYGATFTLVNIKLFDASKLEWSQMNATCDEIESRLYFSSVFIPPADYSPLIMDILQIYIMIIFGFEIDTISLSSEVYLYNIKSKKWVQVLVLFPFPFLYPFPPNTTSPYPLKFLTTLLIGLEIVAKWERKQGGTKKINMFISFDDTW